MLPFLDAESFSTTAMGTAVAVVLLALLMMVKVRVVCAALAQGVGREKLAFPPSHPHHHHSFFPPPPPYTHQSFSSSSTKLDPKAPVPTLVEAPDEVLHRQLKYKLPKKAMVTGGNGFVGRRIVSMLLEQGCEVTVFDISGGFQNESRVKMIVGNLVDPKDVAKAVQGIEVIYHVAAPHASHPPAVQYAVNVTGTQNLLQASAAAGVKKFVFTSSASVIYEGKDQAGADEFTPIPTASLDSYTKTKAEAEALVLAANGEKGMLTAAIRPHGIFGPGDRQFFPVLVESARKGKTKYALGKGKNVADFTFVGNVAHAHLLAAEKLGVVKGVEGQAFFVTNDAPLPFWDFLAKVLTGFGYPAPSVKLPAGAMAVVGGWMDGLAGVLRKVGVAFQPTFTRSRVQYLTTHHYYSIEKAKRLLGYTPAWTQEEALALCFQEMMPELANPRAPKPRRATVKKGDAVPKFTTGQVARHNKREDAWIVVDGKVYDVTEYVDIHPGDDAILNFVGGDSSKGFHGPQHPVSVWDVIAEYEIGVVA